MRSRPEIKAIGKAAFQVNYWNCVLTALLITAILGALDWFTGGQSVQQAVQGSREISNVTVRSNGGGLLRLLLAGPLGIGLNSFFVRNAIGDRAGLQVTTPISAAFENYPRKLGGSLWKGLFIFLWSLLLLIPGIIKGFSYAMTEYILADCPNVKATDALKLSMRMMNGHKWEYFVLHLSFLGWGLLSLCTLGILGVFYVSPYWNSTKAVYYLEIREEALRTGAVTEEQLAGILPA